VDERLHVTHIAALSRNRADLNDATPSVFDHVAGGGLSRQERAREIYAKHALPIFEARIQRQLVQGNARIVDGNVDVAEPPNGFRDLSVALTGIGNVRLKGVGRATGLCNGGCRSCRAVAITVCT
jgi:hypothetical protein